MKLESRTVASVLTALLCLVSQAAGATPLEKSKTDAPKSVSRKETSGPTVLPAPADATAMQAAAAARRDSDPELNGLAKDVPPATDVKR
jgi:hypothetical protein